MYIEACQASSLPTRFLLILSTGAGPGAEAGITVCCFFFFFRELPSIVLPIKLVSGIVL